MRILILIKSLDEFRRRAESLSKEKYDVYYGRNFVLLRPSVTTRGRDSFLIKNLSSEEVESFVNWWGKMRAYEVEEMEFDETKYRLEYGK
jgi:hypothetical protein